MADATAGRLIRLENSIFDEWPAEDVQQYLGLMERYLQAFRCKLPVTLVICGTASPIDTSSSER